MLFISPVSLRQQVPQGFYVGDQKVSFTSRFFFLQIENERKKTDDISEENKGERCGALFIVLHMLFWHPKALIRSCPCSACFVQAQNLGSSKTCCFMEAFIMKVSL